MSRKMVNRSWRGVLKPVVRPLLLEIFNLAGAVWRGPLPTPILAYHSLDESGSQISLSPAIFRRQIEYLASRGYRTLALSEYRQCLEEGKDPPQPSVVLTFDDGYCNFLEEGYPILQSYGYRATIFIQTDFIGKRSTFSRDLSLPIMGENDIRWLAAEGCEIGSHTCSHPALTKIPISEARREIFSSREVLTVVTEEEVTSFCYPFGDYDCRTERLVAESGYRSAVTLEPGNKNGPEVLFSLRRIVIGPKIVPAYFKLILGNNFDIYNRVFQLSLRPGSPSDCR